jgi:heptosyltransferase I
MLVSAQRTLVCLHYGIGDVIMQLPVLQALTDFIPSAAITLLGAQPALELFDDDRRWDSVQNIQAWGLQHWGDKGDSTIRAAVGSWIEHRGFDMILDVSHAVEAVKEVIWASSHRNGHRTILDTGAYLPTYDLNGVQAIKHSVALRWGLSVPEQAKPRIQLEKHRLQFADDYLLRHLNGKPPIAISALASSALKRWSAERLARTAAALNTRFDLPIMIFAGPQTRAAAQLAALLTCPPIIVESFHLLDTAALLSRCAILICNDTGLMHMGAAVGTPIVAVFGPTTESIYLPPASFCKGVSSTVACPHRKTGIFGPAPCLVERRCLIQRYSCIDSISVSTVMQAAMDLLIETLEGGLRNNA